MKIAVCFALLCGVVNCGLITGPLTTLVRAPSFDSAVIQSDRLGGNFAYSTAEGHAYAAISPIVDNVLKPIAVSYSAQPVVAAYAPAPVLHGTTVVHSAPVLSPAVVPFLPSVVNSIVSAVAETPADPVPAVADQLPAAAAPVPAAADSPEASDDAVEVNAQ